MHDNFGRTKSFGDARFDSHQNLSANAADAAAIIREEIGKHTLAEWTARFQTLEGQWAPVQNTVEVLADPQVRANGYIAPCTSSEGKDFELAAVPVQFDEEPVATHRAPDFNEHCAEILAEAGIGAERMIELQIAGVVA